MLAFIQAANPAANRFIPPSPRPTVHLQRPPTGDDREQRGGDKANDQHHHTDLHGH